MFENISIEEMVDLFAKAPEETLQGVTLIREHSPQPGEIFPRGLSRQTYIEALQEMMQYSGRCAEFGKMLSGLPAIPIEIPIEEYPL